MSSPAAATKGQVVVVGSANQDLTAYTATVPKTGETSVINYILSSLLAAVYLLPCCLTMGRASFFHVGGNNNSIGLNYFSAGLPSTFIRGIQARRANEDTEV